LLLTKGHLQVLPMAGEDQGVLKLVGVERLFFPTRPDIPPAFYPSRDQIGPLRANECLLLKSPEFHAPSHRQLPKTPEFCESAILSPKQKIKLKV
jgi:hypothetical protein